MSIGNPTSASTAGGKVFIDKEASQTMRIFLLECLRCPHFGSSLAGIQTGNNRQRTSYSQ